jgi:hypothetical protein
VTETKEPVDETPKYRHECAADAYSVYTDATCKPDFCYPCWPQRSREAIRSAGNYKYATESLFIERAPDPSTALYTLGEDAKFVNGRWYPSAWMIFVHSMDEYDGLRKLVGNVAHWEHLKTVYWFKEIYPEWLAEQAYLQKSKMREALYLQAIVPGATGGATAARLVLAMIDQNIEKRGRPRKKDTQKNDDGDVSADALRMANLRVAGGRG